MKTSIRRSLAMTAIVTLLALAAFLDSATAQAQCIAANTTGCTVNLTLYDANNVLFTVVVPGGGTPVFFALPAGYVPVGVRSSGGFFYPFNANGCTPCMKLPPLSCCGIVCYAPASCSFKISACPPATCLP